jgi:hypothetical protein
MNKRFGIVIILAHFFFAVSGQHKNNSDQRHDTAIRLHHQYEESTTYDSIIAGKLNLDSLINKRMRYYLSQFKSKEDFEKFYGKTTDSMITDIKRDFEQYKQWKTGK